MDPQQFEDVANEIQSLHRSIKNVTEISFAISPLLALSTRGWASKSLNSVYLVRVSRFWCSFLDLLTIIKIFNALGNDRPQILIDLEDCVLKGIIAISEGTSREEAMQALYLQISSLSKDLSKDDKALSWFNLSSDAQAAPTTPPPPHHPIFLQLLYCATYLEITSSISRKVSDLVNDQGAI